MDKENPKVGDILVLNLRSKDIIKVTSVCEKYLEYIILSKIKKNGCRSFPKRPQHVNRIKLDYYHQYAKSEDNPYIMLNNELKDISSSYCNFFEKHLLNYDLMSV